MRLSLPSLRLATITYSRRDLLVVGVIAAVVALWVAVAGGTFSAGALLASEAIFFAFYLVGSLFASWKALAGDILFDLPLRLLVGYIVVNTVLLALAVISPFGIVVNFCAVLAAALLIFWRAARRSAEPGTAAGMWAVGVCLVATALWCQDSIHPISDQGDVLVFKPWVDGFYHAVHVRIFGAAHGASTIQDFRLAGVPARPYHYGIYLFPAFIKQASGIASYTAFAAVLAPVGVFFTGLAAYAFFGSLWGAWSGVAAASALLLLPDGSQQGFGNRFMSYQWLTQISPSATYGLAVLAVAWLFVLKGCTRGSRLQLLAGWLVAGMVVVYKAHYIIASVLLLLLIPALLFQGELGWRRRGLAVVGACAIYGLVLLVAAKVPGMPLIRYDGSSAGEILRLVHSFAKPGGFYSFALLDAVAAHVGPRASFIANLLYGVPYVLLTAFGLFVPVLVILVILLRRRVPLLHRLFPLALLANFLLMFFGLALDFDSSTPDELSHRPVLIVYFFVVSWIGGALGAVFIDTPRLSRAARPVLVGVAALLLAIPALLGPGIQLMWAMPRISPVRVPAALVQVADYIRAHGASDDIFQDSQFDRLYAVAALSERRAWAAHTLTRMPFRGELIQARQDAVEHFMSLRQPQLIIGTAHALGFRWFLLQLGDRVDWPPAIADHPVFQTGPFKLYQF